ncbi:37S ribosomal protein S22 [Malassezia sp. CBS 17886]|nr:37S ribosomal protein S22 [Malassezia sp. CBS 17886]
MHTLPSVLRSPRYARLYGAAQTSRDVGGSDRAPDVGARRRVHEAPPSASQLRLSPAARFGSARVGGQSVVALPGGLEEAAARIVDDADVRQLRRDVAHLSDLACEQPGLAPLRTELFRASLHGLRATSLYLTTQFPARHAVLVRVLDEARRRVLGAASPGTWAPRRILDYNANVADVLWAALAVFPAPGAIAEYEGEASSRELMRAGIAAARGGEAGRGSEDERAGAAGLRAHGPADTQHTPADTSPASSASMAHVRRTFRLRGDRAHVVDTQRPSIDVPYSETLAVDAYGLSALPTDAARERSVLRMWKSGAETLVLVDEATPRGFASIAAARAQLLTLGREAHERDGRGSFVVAPCSHDAPCPILNSAVATQQRTRRRDLSLCKHSHMYRAPTYSHAAFGKRASDHVAEFCYVIVQRGARKSLADAALENLGAHGRPAFAEDDVAAAAASIAAAPKAGVLDTLRRGMDGGLGEESAGVGGDCADVDVRAPGSVVHPAHATERAPHGTPESNGAPEDGGVPPSRAAAPGRDDSSLPASAPHPSKPVDALYAAGYTAERAMQVDALHWPRLLRPPLKKGGHVTMDACCPTGDIRRFTVAKSAGAQVYQDARKAHAGDIFPHSDKSGRATVIAPGGVEATEERAAAEAAEAAAAHHANTVVLAPDDGDMSPAARRARAQNMILVGLAGAPAAPTHKARRHAPVGADEEHIHINAEAQLLASEGKAPKTSRRAPKRAPKARAQEQAVREGLRSSRKQSRGDMDEALREYGW